MRGWFLGAAALLAALALSTCEGRASDPPPLWASALVFMACDGGDPEPVGRGCRILRVELYGASWLQCQMGAPQMAAAFLAEARAGERLAAAWCA